MLLYGLTARPERRVATEMRCLVSNAVLGSWLGLPRLEAGPGRLIDETATSRD